MIKMICLKIKLIDTKRVRNLTVGSESGEYL